ncbi:TlpA family protein disulfide reductase [Azospira restricta]|uniref:TlpA family protein disulfide reductase n=1 Tax=Azospira restricta TaxID=404405 RepID=A0A974Y3V0_9RHOO|nr:TlpA disulfide reductase family protein [Azospira restricta]QRJ64098.1 TlpA family protein disulfide reductase [Azospira restricta]
MTLRRRGRVLFAALALLTAASAAADAPATLPPLQAETLAGERLAPAVAPGAVTVLFLWSPDSLAARKSVGELQRFDAAFRARGVRTLAISTLRDAERLRAYAAEQRLDFPQLILGEHGLGPLPNERLPRLYVLDRDGRVRAAHAGLFRLRDLERAVEPLLSR